MTYIKETDLQDLENVTGGALAEFDQLAQTLYASPLTQYPAKFASNLEHISDSDLINFVKDQLEKNYAVNADFHLISDDNINVFTDEITGQQLSFSDVLAKIQFA